MFIKTRKTIKRFLRQVFKGSNEELKDDVVVKDEVIEVKPKKEKETKVEVKEEVKEAKVEVKEAPKAETPKVEAKEEERSTTEPKYHVSYNRDPKSDNFRRWRVRRAGSRKTIKFFDTQVEAIEYAQHLADNNNTSIVIHKMDGSIRKQDYSK